MKEESDIPLLKSYNKDTTVIETDPFMEKEIDELIRAYAQPQEIIRRLKRCRLFGRRSKAKL